MSGFSMGGGNYDEFPWGWYFMSGFPWGWYFMLGFPWWAGAGIVCRGFREGHFVSVYLKVIRVLLIVFINVFMEQGQRIPDEQVCVMAGQLFIDT